MATKLKLIISILRFLSFMTLLTKSVAQSPNYVGDDCKNSTQQSLTSTYKSNLNKVLSLLSSDAIVSKGYNHTSIGDNTVDGVYGLYDCRGDVVGSFCQFCVSTAASDILQHCPNRASATIWYNFCILRYSNRNFFGKLTTDPSWNKSGSEKINNPQELDKAEDNMQSLIKEATLDTKKLFAMSEFNLSTNKKRYGLVQCSRDLNDKQCNQCLEDLLDKVPKCCGTNIGWQVVAPSCLIKYDDVMFYQLISQTSTPLPVGQGGSNKSNTLIIIIVIVLVVAVALMSCCIYFIWRRNHSNQDELQSETIPISLHNRKENESLNHELPIIPLTWIKRSTNNFSELCKLGEGGFGPVYKGNLLDGTEVAIKRLSITSGQDFHLFGTDDGKRELLDWKLRLNIINGIAKGLLYLHEDSRLRVIHRDLKASNVLLDQEMNPKISDFGLARAFEKDQCQENTRRVVGTYGYMSPEYAMEGLYSVKSDVFSFGVLLLEIICGKRNSGFYLGEHGQSLLIYSWNLWYEGKSLELLDPILKKTYIANEVVRCIHIGLLCVQEDAIDRPTMSNVVVMLASDTMALPNPNNPAFSVGRKFKEDESTSKTSNDPSVNEVTVSNIFPR
ncbi:hypothetical protein P8452_19102 [Trifolium repens]|nr:hypothetical protein P8452_19102 [Trifolium repens]